MTAQLNLFLNSAGVPPSASGGASNAFIASPRRTHRAGTREAATFSRYPLRAGYKDDTTSLDAAVKVEETGFAEKMRQKCLVVLSRHSMTPKELAAYLGANLDSVRPRCSELYHRGLIVRTGDRRDGQHVLARAA